MGKKRKMQNALPRGQLVKETVQKEFVAQSAVGLGGEFVFGMMRSYIRGYLNPKTLPSYPVTPFAGVPKIMVERLIHLKLVEPSFSTHPWIHDANNERGMCNEILRILKMDPRGEVSGYIKTKNERVNFKAFEEAPIVFNGISYRNPKRKTMKAVLGTHLQPIVVEYTPYADGMRLHVLWPYSGDR